MHTYVSHLTQDLKASCACSCMQALCACSCIGMRLESHESCHIYGWMSRDTIPVKYKNDSRFTHINESCPYWVISHMDGWAGIPYQATHTNFRECLVQALSHALGFKVSCVCIWKFEYVWRMNVQDFSHSQWVCEYMNIYKSLTHMSAWIYTSP